MASVARDIGILPPRTISVNTPELRSADNPAPALRMPTASSDVLRSISEVEARRRQSQRGVDRLRVREPANVTGLFIPGGGS